MGSTLSDKTTASLQDDIFAAAMKPENRAVLTKLMADKFAGAPPPSIPAVGAPPPPIVVSPPMPASTGGAKKKLRMKKRGTRSTRRKGKKAKGTRRSR